MFERKRLEMVERCVRAEGISDIRIIRAMKTVPRHLFVEPALAHQAYFGKSLPIGFGQTISHPTTVALMTANLQLADGARVLEIGTGSGYQAAVLAEMGMKVYSVERIPELARRTRRLLEDLGYYSVAVQIGDGTGGWPHYAPYDGILVTAASPQIPEALLQQLKISGRLVIPVGDRASQNLAVVLREEDHFEIKKIGDHKFVPLIGKDGWEDA